jgi:phage protein D
MANNDRTVPTSRNPDVVTFTIQVDGTALPGTYQILGITVSRALNRLPMAEVVIKDGDPASESFLASSGEEFVPGKDLKVLLGYHSDEEVVFEGKIVRQSIRVREGSSRLYVDCRDAAFVTSLVRKSRYFEDSTDSDAIETIVSEYSGLQAEVDATSVTHRELMQYRSTDWDFILSRADANGLLVDANAGNLRCFAPDFGAEPVLSIQYGATILELDAELDGRTQFPGVKAFGWSPANQETEEVEAADPGYAGPGNLSGDQLAGDLAVPEEELRHSGWLPADELQAWADTRLLHSRLARVRGRVRLPSAPEI